MSGKKFIKQSIHNSEKKNKPFELQPPERKHGTAVLAHLVLTLNAFSAIKDHTKYILVKIK